MDSLLMIDRLRSFMASEPYDPATGSGCGGDRREVATPVEGLPYAMVPESMVADPAYKAACTDAVAWRRLRCRHDFEYWAFSCVMVKHKERSGDVAFTLNAPQRRVLGVLEADRLAGEPIRLILLKARQWGGSTLVQMYMAWIQTVHRTNWNSVICAHVKDTSAVIRGMYSKMLAAYPPELWEGDEAPAFKPYERSTNVRTIAGRGCRVTLGTAEKPDSVRGSDYAMAHLSETAFWPSSASRSPRAVVQAVCGSVSLLPYTFIAIESTARGVGDFFHSEWVRCKAGAGDKHAVFVPWQEIDFYRLAGSDAEAVLASMDADEHWLWEHGCTSENLRWRRRKLREFEGGEGFDAEYPGDDILAFSSAKGVVFSAAAVERLRKGCEIMPRTGDIDASGSTFTDDAGGGMKMWESPRRDGRYVVAVDVGGRSAGADWSVIAVLEDCEHPRVVAQWRGHIDHDLLAAKCVAVARYYSGALLVIESNTFETGEYGGGDSNLFVLNRIAEAYSNVYMRESFDVLTRTVSRRVGFHTNRSTKAMIIAGLIEAVREGAYVERDPEACNELLTYEQAPNGSYAAKQGKHDDILMTRAIALHVLRSNPLPPPPPQGYTQRPQW
ncbi:MAG: hypothetical protein NC418_00850 [Muribaculaceae bacterium]|nr:hypothetical protein [Muribaculaceae bacterium]